MEDVQDAVENIVQHVLRRATSSTRGVVTAGVLLQERHILRALAPFKEVARPVRAYMIPVAADGNCCPTACRGSADLEIAVRAALRALDLGEEPDGMPHLDCSAGSDNNVDSADIRYVTDQWFRATPEKMRRTLRGKISYEVLEDGVKVIRERPMERMDLIIMELMDKHKNIDMSLEASAIQRRVALVNEYLDKQMNGGGTWASTPLLMCFASSRSPGPVPIRIYQRIGGRLTIYNDIIPDKCTVVLPPEEEDDLLNEPVAEDEEEEDDAAEWTPSMEDAEEPSEEEEAENEEEEPFYEQNFTRLLFSEPGHYDVLATCFQKRVITAIWPHLDAEFRPMVW